MAGAREASGHLRVHPSHVNSMLQAHVRFDGGRFYNGRRRSDRPRWPGSDGEMVKPHLTTPRPPSRMPHPVPIIALEVQAPCQPNVIPATLT